MTETTFYRVERHPVTRKWAVCFPDGDGQLVFVDEGWKLQEDAELQAMQLERQRLREMGNG